MKSHTITPLQENWYSETSEKTVFYFYDKDSKPIYKTKEIYKNASRFIFYPFTFNRNTGELKPRKITYIEFTGWTNLVSLPIDFKSTPPYGLRSKRIKALLSLIYPKFKEFSKISIGKNTKTRFSKYKITFNYNELNALLRSISKEIGIADKDRKHHINNLLSDFSSKYIKASKKLTAGDLNFFLNKFDSYDKITTKDAEALSKVFEKLPSNKIIATTNFIQTKEKLDIIFLEDVIEKFKTLMNVKKDNEEQWQTFFEKYAWVLNHLFPFQVILKKGKAYVGGKTIEDSKGRVVDFLFENHLEDNYALLEIKTHLKKLLKLNPYRKPDVFAFDDELSGGINQCLDQKDSFLREFGEKNPSYDPKTILVIGQKDHLTKSQKKCFELIRANQKNVDIVTFDELLRKLEGFYRIITGGNTK